MEKYSVDRRGCRKLYIKYRASGEYEDKFSGILKAMEQWMGRERICYCNNYVFGGEEIKKF